MTFQTDDSLLHQAGDRLANYLKCFSEYATFNKDSINPQQEAGSFHVHAGPKQIYKVFSKLNGTALDWIVGHIHRSNDKEFNNNLSILLNLDLYPGGFLGVSKEALEHLVQRFGPSVMGTMFNLNVDIGTEDSKYLIEAGHRVIEFTPMDDSGVSFAIACYENKEELPVKVTLHQVVKTQNGEVKCLASFAELTEVQNVNKNSTRKDMSKQKEKQSSMKFDDTCSELASIINRMYDHLGESKAVWGFGGNSGSIYLPDSLHKYDFIKIHATQDEGGGRHQAMQILENCIKHFMGEAIAPEPLSVFINDPFNRASDWSVISTIQTTLNHSLVVGTYKTFVNAFPLSVSGNVLMVTEVNCGDEGYLISYFPTSRPEGVANLHIYMRFEDNYWNVAVAGMPEQEGQRKVNVASTDKPQPVNKSFQQRTNEIMAKQKKVKSDYLLDEFMQVVLHLGEGNVTELSKAQDGHAVVSCGSLSYKFSKCNSTIATIAQVVDLIANHQSDTTERRLGILREHGFGSTGTPQLLNQKHSILKHLSDKLTARNITPLLFNSHEIIADLPFFTICLTLSARSDVVFIEVYPPHSLEDAEPVIIITVDLKSMRCLFATMESASDKTGQDVLPWEDDVEVKGSTSRQWVSEHPKLDQKPGTLFLIEQNGEGDLQRIHAIRKRLVETFKTVELDIHAELLSQEKLSDNHPPLIDQIKGILLQGKSVIVTWRSDTVTGKLCNLANFAGKVLEWVEMAREIKAPHYYIGNF